jgi:hypothetical protein
MEGVVVGVALRQELPLRAGIQNAEYGLQDRSCRNRLVAGAAIRDVLFSKVFANPFPFIGRPAAAAYPDLYG